MAPDLSTERAMGSIERPGAPLLFTGLILESQADGNMASAPIDHSRVRPSGFTRSGMTTKPDERVREVLADRSTLVRVRLLAPELWVKKDDRPHCVFCTRRFRTFSRKIHCRSCGEVFCSSCNKKRDVQIGPTIDDTLPVRLCLDCIDKAMAASPASDAEDELDFEGSFTNSGRVTLSSCSSHMKPADGLLASMRSTASGGTAPTDSFVNLELSHLEDDSEAGDTDAESAYSYDSDTTSLDGNEGSEEYAEGRGRGKSISSCTNSTVSSSGSSSSGCRALGLVPEEVDISDLASDLELKLSDLDSTRRPDLLKEYNVTTPERQREFDAICQLVSRALNCGVAAVAFMGETSQWYKAKIGISQARLPREVAMCSKVVHSRAATIVMDASKDSRFEDNPLVKGSAHIRFYASMPICDPKTGIVLGSVFAMDPKVKTQLPSRTMEVLAYATSQVEKLLELSRGTKSRKRQQRMRRVFSEPTITDGSGDDDDDDDDEPCTKSTGARGGALWTTEPPERLCSRRSSMGIRLLDLESFRSLSRRPSTSSDCDDEPDRVRSAPSLQRHNSEASMSAVGLCDEIKQHIETTQHLLSSFGPRASRKASTSPGPLASEVEV